VAQISQTANVVYAHFLFTKEGYYKKDKKINCYGFAACFMNVYDMLGAGGRTMSVGVGVGVSVGVSVSVSVSVSVDEIM
jgi:hypothetical protein